MRLNVGKRERTRPGRESRRERPRRRYMARRLEILRAAGKIFRSRGFAESGMREIADAADISAANLYNYFHGKHEILYFCQDSSLDRLITSLKAARQLKASAGEKLRALVIWHLRCVLDEVEGSVAHFLTAGLPSAMQRRLVAKRDRYEAGVRELIVAGVKSGEFVTADAALAARAVLGAVNSSVLWFNPEGVMPAEDVAEKFADYLVRGLLRDITDFAR